MPSKGRVRSLCKPLWGISCKPPWHLWPSTTFPLASASQLYLAQAASAKTLFSSASAASNSERACPQVARFGYNLDFLFSPSTNHHFFTDYILSFSRWLLVITPSWRLQTMIHIPRDSSGYTSETGADSGCPKNLSQRVLWFISTGSALD